MSLNVTLNSSWVSLSDFISIAAYNKLKADVLNVAVARGMMTLSDGVYTNTTTNTQVSVPDDKVAGEIVKIQDIKDLQNIAKNTVAYNGSDQTTYSSSKTDDNGDTYTDVSVSSYPYKNPSNLSKPLALLYNEVRQVVIDSYAGAGCANSCSTACKSSCSQTCYSACTTQCSSGSCSGSCGGGSDCNASCVSGCKGTCSNSTCTATCITNCSSTASCGNSCTGSCKTSCSGTCLAICENSSCSIDCGSMCAWSCIGGTCKPRSESYSGCSNSCSGRCIYNGACSGSCWNYCVSGGEASTSCGSVGGYGCSASCLRACDSSGCGSGTSSCTSACTSGCSTYCSGGAAQCGNACTSTCQGTGCKISCAQDCAGGCSTDCAGTCIASYCQTTCSAGCYSSCYTDCGTSCVNDSGCTSTCYNGCSNGCGTDSACSSLVTGSGAETFTEKSIGDGADKRPSSWIHDATSTKVAETNSGNWTEGSILNGSSENPGDGVFDFRFKNSDGYWFRMDIYQKNNIDKVVKDENGNYTIYMHDTVDYAGGYTSGIGVTYSRRTSIFTLPYDGGKTGISSLNSSDITISSSHWSDGDHLSSELSSYNGGQWSIAYNIDLKYDGGYYGITDTANDEYAKYFVGKTVKESFTTADGKTFTLVVTIKE